MTNNDLHELRVALMEFGWDGCGTPQDRLRLQLSACYRKLWDLNEALARRDKAEAKLARCVEALEKVRKLHVRLDLTTPICRECRREWSCPTVLAAQAALAAVKGEL